MADLLFEKRADGVALITLNRPDSLNAMTGEMMTLLADALEDCDHDDEVRCVALTGTGRAFCAGGDVKAMRQRSEAAEDGDGSADEGAALEDTIAELRRAHLATSGRLHTLSKPTVALVNGYAMGAGMSLSLACDLRLCSDRAKFGTAFRNVALSGDYGGSFFLQGLVGSGRARELYLTGEIIEAERALEIGIATRVIAHEDLLEEGLAFCASLAAGPTRTFARMKANLNFAENGASMAEALDNEAFYQRMGARDGDHREAALAFTENRKPQFRGR